ncbi:MAG TPA: pyruvate kinase, partial [Planctomycetota bacterium]|nr:pyruvate kinase [Planctomycetota bacterium]
MRLTKIVCTLGPACEEIDVLEKMIRSGMDVARLNFSHGSYAQHETTLTRVRAVARSLGKTVAVIQDLCGPKIRVGAVAGGATEFVTDSSVRFYRDAVEADAGQFSCTCPEVVADLKLGDRVLINDGRVQMVVVAVEPDRATLHVTEGGRVLPEKGINLPGVTLRMPALTEKDRADLEWGLAHDVDYVALSFVRSPDDVLELRRILHEHTSDIHVIAKLEKPEAVNRLQEIIEVSDVVMVARGDLGVEMPLERIPGIQKQIIRAAALQGKPVITATEMLQSMILEPTPTRAEVTDVANAILDGSDAVMLSGETAVGRYPLEAVLTMARIAEEADKMRAQLAGTRPSPMETSDLPMTEAVALGARGIAQKIPAKLVAVGTHSGHTARILSKEDLAIPILATSDDLRACQRMALYRGVIPVQLQGLLDLDQMLSEIERVALERKLAVAGELIVILGGVPFGKSGTTNTVQVRRLQAGETAAPASSRAR